MLRECGMCARPKVTGYGDAAMKSEREWDCG